MANRIKESEIDTTELRRYTDFLLAAPGEVGTGVPVFHLRELAPLSGPLAPAKVMDVRHLVIEVDDPDSAQTIERLRRAITDRLRSV